MSKIKNMSRGGWIVVGFVWPFCSSRLAWRSAAALKTPGSRVRMESTATPRTKPGSPRRVSCG